MTSETCLEIGVKYSGDVRVKYSIVLFGLWRQAVEGTQRIPAWSLVTWILASDWSRLVTWPEYWPLICRASSLCVSVLDYTRSDNRKMGVNWQAQSQVQIQFLPSLKVKNVGHRIWKPRVADDCKSMKLPVLLNKLSSFYFKPRILMTWVVYKMRDRPPPHKRCSTNNRVSLPFR